MADKYLTIFGMIVAFMATVAFCSLLVALTSYFITEMLDHIKEWRERRSYAKRPPDHSNL